jgi:hypothetical protein
MDALHFSRARLKIDIKMLIFKVSLLRNLSSNVGPTNMILPSAGDSTALGTCGLTRSGSRKKFITKIVKIKAITVKNVQPRKRSRINRTVIPKIYGRPGLAIGIRGIAPATINY